MTLSQNRITSQGVVYFNFLFFKFNKFSIVLSFSKFYIDIFNNNLLRFTIYFYFSWLKKLLIFI
jgi:hypothetical protein